MNRDTRKLVRRMKSHRLAMAAIATRSATIRPARTPGVDSAKPTSAMAPTRRTVRHARPNSNLRLKSMLLHAPVERAPAEAEFGGGKRHVEMVHSKRPLDHLPLELVEVEAVAHHRHGRGFRSGGEWEVLYPVAVALGHDDRALRGVAKGPDIARPVMPHQRIEHGRRQVALGLVILARVEPKIMVEQQRDILPPLAQRRKLDLDRIEPEQQVLPKALG